MRVPVWGARLTGEFVSPSHQDLTWRSSLCEALSEYETREVYEDRSRNVYHVDRIRYFTDEVVASAVWASQLRLVPAVDAAAAQIAQLQLRMSTVVT